MTGITLKVDGLEICGEIYFPATRPPYPAVCICHGLPARRYDPSDRGYAELAEKVAGQGFAAMIFNFRGAGRSGGNLDLPGWKKDLVAAIDYLSNRPDIAEERLFVLSFSAGAAVAVCVAAEDKRVAGLVLGACPAGFNFIGSDPQATIAHFRSLDLFRDKDYPPSTAAWFKGFQSIRPLDCISAVSPRPVLLLHGSRDETVPLTDAYKLFNAAAEPKQLAIIEGAGHRLRLEERAMTAAIAWLKSRAE